MNCEFAVFGKVPCNLIGAVYRVGRCVSSFAVAVFTVGCVIMFV